MTIKKYSPIKILTLGVFEQDILRTDCVRDDHCTTQLDRYLITDFFPLGDLSTNFELETLTNLFRPIIAEKSSGFEPTIIIKCPEFNAQPIVSENKLDEKFFWLK